MTFCCVWKYLPTHSPWHKNEINLSFDRDTRKRENSKVGWNFLCVHQSKLKAYMKIKIDFSVFPLHIPHLIIVTAGFSPYNLSQFFKHFFFITFDHEGKKFKNINLYQHSIFCYWRFRKRVHAQLDNVYPDIAFILDSLRFLYCTYLLLFMPISALKVLTQFNKWRNILQLFFFVASHQMAFLVCFANFYNSIFFTHSIYCKVAENL